MDWSNPLARGLICAINHAEPVFDLVAGSLVENTRTKSVGSAGRNTTATGLITVPSSSLLQSGTGDNGRTVFFLLATTTTGNTVIAEKGTNENFVCQTLSSKFNWRAAGSGLEAISTTSNITSGLPVAVAGTYAKTSFVQQVFFAGVAEASNTGITEAANSSPLVIGARVGNLFEFPGDIYISCFWNRVLTDQEIAQVSANPWQLFAPRQIWIPASAASALPTLSNPTAINITASSFQPRVSYAF